MPTARNLPNIPNETETSLATELLDLLDRWSQSQEPHHVEQRQHPRKAFRSQVAVYCVSPVPLESEVAFGWCRNISDGGLSFISRSRIETSDVRICLDFQGACESWIEGSIVRSQGVPQGFYEYGVKFSSQPSNAAEIVDLCNSGAGDEPKCSN